MAIKLTQFAQFTRLTHFIKFSQFKFDTTNLANYVNKVNYVNFFLLALCFLLVFSGGCASLLQKEDILAVVNGEPITGEDLKYSLQIAHRKEDLSSAGTLNLSQFIQKLVDDRLIVQEAYRMGMEEYPEVQQALQAYILRESVVRLYNDEITKKVTVTDEDIISYYKKNFEKFSLGIIEVDSEDNAQVIVEQFKKGFDFKELAKKYSTNRSQKDGGEVVLRRNSLLPPVEKAVSILKPGEISDVIKMQNKYYIVKLINKEEASAEEAQKCQGKYRKVYQETEGKRAQ